MLKNLASALILCLIFSVNISAQTQSEGASKSKGSIKVDIPDDIKKNLEKNTGTPQKNNNSGTTNKNNTNTGKSTNKSNSSSSKNNTQTNGKKKNEQATDNKGKNNLKSGVNKLQGYRIQVFSDGRNPTTLQARARARGNAIVAKFPKYRGQVYSFSQSPNWYTRIGNFQTSEEANKALKELKNAFPGFAAEMRVVKSTITIIK